MTSVSGSRAVFSNGERGARGVKRHLPSYDSGGPEIFIEGVYTRSENPVEWPPAGGEGGGRLLRSNIGRVCKISFFFKKETYRSEGERR